MIPIYNRTLHSLKVLFKDIYFLIVLVLLIGVFIYKYQDLFLPFFSDELWTYGPAIRKMSVFGPSLLPSSLPLTDHWAHPLLFFFLSSLWCLIFGASLFSVHLFAALLSSLLLVVLYLTVKNMLNREIAFYSTLIFASQSIFLGQYNLALPEILTTIFTYLVIYFSEKKKYKLFIFFGICLVLTKESGVFPLIAIIGWNLIRDIFYDKSFSFSKQTIVKYIIFTVPFIAIVSHFVLLKLEYGWFIMPLRTESFEFTWDVYHERLMNTIHYLFIGQGRRPLPITLFFIGILFYPKIKILYRIVIVLVSFSLMKMFFGYWEVPEFVEFLVIPIIFIVIVKFIFIDSYKNDRSESGFIAIATLFTIIYILFISSFFDSRRYLLFLVPTLIVITIYFLNQIPKINKYLLPLVAIVSIGFSIQYQINDTDQGDDTNHYQDLCFIQKEAVGYLEEKYQYTQSIRTTFLVKHSLERPLTGYLKTITKFSNVASLAKDGNNCLYIFVNTELPNDYYSFKKEKNLKLVKKFEKRNAWIEIYKN
ncbi:glycosyltransferase family 39 protein [Vicingus serpentipes]|uniref:glycosyltransferase family 39 protein n=1 Tax=Vicingus serpentipes TaxID=1926625 RepID=UPI00147696B6|nr:glycosyltransferase family 39 protein [Vicingus serpentipes]